MKTPASVLLLALLLSTGCATDYEARTPRLRVGMTEAEAEAVMGRPYATEIIAGGGAVGDRWTGVMWKYPSGVRLTFQQSPPPRVLRAWTTR